MPVSRKPSQADSAPRLRDVIPFPSESLAAPSRNERDSSGAIGAFENVSRRLEDLARRLNCVGFFEDSDPNRPRAA